jgi:SpoIID/LytB domain protein
LRAARIVILAAALVLPASASAGTVFLVDGRGWGHGVGMSQWGAEGAAQQGWDYRRILAHYYPGTTVEAWEPKPVRVLLARGLAKARIASPKPFVVSDARGHELHLPARAVVLDKRLLLKKRKLVPPLRFTAGAEPLTLGGHGYRGDLVVKRRPGGLMVVNELPLDRYLRGVVPWEVPKDWHEATYRAQAVAARSYTLATLHPGADFDLLPDQRDQMYGGIEAERPSTNLAIGSTAGEVLTYRGRVITAFYHSSSGGRTSSVHDAWPKAKQVPYLVSVRDPFDAISPHHVWPTELLTPEQAAARLGVRAVRDMVVLRNSSGRARALRVLTLRGWQDVPGAVVRKKLGLGSTDFQVHAMTLDVPEHPAVYGGRVALRGWVRGLGVARVQVWTGSGWRVVGQIHARADGRFATSLRASASTRVRLAYNGIAGPEVAVLVAPRVRVASSGTKLSVRVAPSLPLRIERLTRAKWQPVARGQGRFARSLRPGSYRVRVLANGSYTTAVSAPVGLH